MFKLGWSLAKSVIVYLASRVPRWYFSPERLARLVYIDVVPRGEQIQFNLGNPPSVIVYLRIVNFSSFAVHLHHLKLEIQGLGQPLPIDQSVLVDVAARNYKDFSLTGLTGMDFQKYLSECTSTDLPSLNLVASLKCSIREFTVEAHSYKRQLVHMSICNASNELRQRFTR